MRVNHRGALASFVIIALIAAGTRTARADAADPTPTVFVHIEGRSGLKLLRYNTKVAD